MSRTRSRSDSIREDEELRLPRAPGLFRRFWARHPLFADVVLTLLCLLLSLAPAGRLVDESLPEATYIAINVATLAMVVIACSTLLWRRRAPLGPFIAAVVLGTVGLFTGLSSGIILLLMPATVSPSTGLRAPPGPATGSGPRGSSRSAHCSRSAVPSRCRTVWTPRSATSCSA